MDTRIKLVGKVIAMVGALALLVPAGPAAAKPVVLGASLTGGDAEVPDPGDPDGSGAARVTVDVKKEKLCFVLVVLDVTLPTAAAHIHAGAAGVAGDVVVTLKAPEELAGTGIGVATGCVKDQERSLLRDIKNNPGEYYVNVHTSDFPGGAVRGQLEAA